MILVPAATEVRARWVGEEGLERPPARGESWGRAAADEVTGGQGGSRDGGI